MFLRLILFFIVSNIACLSFAEQETQLLKVLHISFHKGCLKELESIAPEIGINVTSWFVNEDPAKYDGCRCGNAIYNVDKFRAKRVWDLNKDYFDSFDVIFTSDTAPLSRIFLQNNWKKPLIIWVCNRFDYADGGSRNRYFPDAEYYDLIRNIPQRSNVQIIPYTQFENHYAQTRNKIYFSDNVIKPCSKQDQIWGDKSGIPASVKKEETMFVPPYQQNAQAGVVRECQRLGIKHYNGRYNGPADLKGFKGIIHIPNAWSNFHLFENIQNGIPYFVPSRTFARQILQRTYHTNKGYLFNDIGFDLSEWWTRDHKKIITYFDSWEDLKQKIEQANFDRLHKKIQAFGDQHHDTMINKWKKVFAQAKEYLVTHNLMNEN